MLPRTKYNRFRNDSVTSVDDLLHNLSVSGGGKVSAARAAPAAAPYLVSGDALRRAPDDGPGSLGHLLHKVSHLKLSSSGLRGRSAARARAGARLSGSCSAPSLAAPDGSAPPGPVAPAMRAARKGRPGDQPPPRAPHASDQVLGAGVTYVVKVGAGAGLRVGRRGGREARAPSWPARGAMGTGFCQRARCAPVGRSFAMGDLTLACFLLAFTPLATCVRPVALWAWAPVPGKWASGPYSEHTWKDPTALP